MTTFIDPTAILVTPSGQGDIDALLYGTAWAPAAGTTGVTLSYSFPGLGSSWDSYANPGEPTQGLQAVSGNVAQAVRQALAAWSAVSGVNFTEVDETTGAVGDIRVAFTNWHMDSSTVAYAYLPGEQPSAGDIWLNAALSESTLANFDSGSAAMFVLLHEIGHALGLKHPQDVSIYTGAQLDAPDDTLFNSVMSTYVWPGIQDTFINLDRFPSTPMSLDIDALQYLYGANTSSHAGDDLYVFNADGKYLQTIYDTGGNDTIELVSSAAGGVIDLRPGAWSQLGLPVSINGGAILEPDTVQIYHTVTIENAIGGEGPDRLIGNDAANRLTGNGGDDTLIGGAGSDSLQGGAGSDTFVLDAGSEDTVVDFHVGEDSIDVTPLIALFHGLSANADLFDQGFLRLTQHGSDTLLEYDTDGPANLDGWHALAILENTSVASLTAASFVQNFPDAQQPSIPGVSLVGSDGNDTLVGSVGDDTLAGLGGDDFLDGRAGDDTLEGGAGNDTLLGGSGNDYLTGGDGADSLDGGDGNDSLVDVASASSPDSNPGGVINGGRGDDLILADFSPALYVDGGDGVDTLVTVGPINEVFDLAHVSNVEVVMLGENAKTVVVGDGTVAAGHTLTIWGNYYYSGGTGAVVDGRQESDGHLHIDMGSTQAYIPVESASDLLYGGAQSDVIYGREGNDTIAGGGGDDTIDGGADFDTAVFSGNYAAYTIVTDVGQLSVAGPDGTDTLRNIEALQFADQTIILVDPGQYLVGNEGGESLVGGAGPDVIYGSAGDDRIFAGGGNDSVEGGSGNDYIDGGSGHDILNGGPGADTMVGGSGTDLYYVDDPNDVVVETDNTPPDASGSTPGHDSAGTMDTVIATISYTLTNFVENLDLSSGVGNLNGTGNDLDNSITGNTGDNVLDGGTGADTMAGGAGNDVYYVDNVNDVVLEFNNTPAGNGNPSPISLGQYAGVSDTVEATVNYALGNFLENLRQLGTANIDGMGNGLRNELIGNDGNNRLQGLGDIDTLSGGLGNDSLEGGAGDDVLDGGPGINTAIFAGLKSDYTFTKMATGYLVADSVAGRDGTDTLSNIEWLQFSDGLSKLGGSPMVDTGGDGKSDILWRDSADGSAQLWQMNGTQVDTHAVLGTQSSDWNIVDAHGDYNGDGKSDILWRNGTDGSVLLWQMDGTQIGKTASLITVPTDWNIVDAHGDYNGDGKSDILWRNNADGSTVIWQMNGLQIGATGGLGGTPLNWSIIDAHGDYNGDGKSDILWRNSTDGSTVVFQMNGTQIGASSGFGAIPTNWGIVDAHGDYNGDGKSDILWRDSTDGSTVIWQMNGTQIGASGGLGAIPVNWNIVDAHGDYNGDGKSDILWRNSDDGSTVIWQMNGTQIGASGGLGPIPLNWNIIDAHGDYNGDGKSDILWRNSSDGGMVIWQMNGTQIGASGGLGVPPASWGVVDGTETGAALTGDNGNNTLLGTVENDTLAGLDGNDTLTGNAGADKFVFNTALNAGTNVDTVTDFASGTDKLVLDHLIFSALSAGNVAAGSLVAEAGASAHDANDYILYDTTTGNLSYDPDGSGALAATQFASLANHPALAAADLTVV